MDLGLRGLWLLHLLYCESYELNGGGRWKGWRGWWQFAWGVAMKIKSRPYTIVGELFSRICTNPTSFRGTFLGYTALSRGTPWMRALAYCIISCHIDSFVFVFVFAGSIRIGNVQFSSLRFKAYHNRSLAQSYRHSVMTWSSSWCS